MIYDFEKNESVTPLYIQLYEHIINKISLGKIRSGEKLPSLREMSLLCSVSINKVINCYSQLETEGYINPVEKSGYYVLPLPEYFYMQNP